MFFQVIKGAEDNPSQYMNFMNVVFTAQKLVSFVDAVSLLRMLGSWHYIPI